MNPELLALIEAFESLREAPAAEKLRVMETLWADLSRNEREIESPVWHEQVLREREQRVRSGQESFIDGKRPTAAP